MKSHTENNQNQTSQSAAESVEVRVNESGLLSAPTGIVDNRPEALAQRKLQAAMNSSPQAMQLKKDAAIHSFGDSKPGETTATKVIDPKDGARGLFKYNYTGGNIIDTFNGKNIADSKIADGTTYAGLSAPNITVKVADHDLGKDYGKGGGKLSDSQMATGGRSTHFTHADNAHGIDRTDKYTWHHLQNKGKMELIDMNVHGAMWHYGGIASWTAGTHSPDATDDDPSA